MDCFDLLPFSVIVLARKTIGIGRNPSENFQTFKKNECSIILPLAKCLFFEYSISMKRERIQQLIRLLRRGEILTSAGAADRFGVSEVTIRRDFEFLTANGEACRFHGGIRAADFRGDPALPIGLRREWRREVKRRLAGAAAAELPLQGCIFVDGGTTTAQLGHFLARPDLRVITNSLALLRSCAEAGEPMPLLQLTGGVYNRKSEILVGPEAVRTVEHFHADAAVISGTALDGDFLYDNREEAAELQRKMMENSEQLIVIADSGKLGGKALCRSLEADRISLLITDFDPEKHPVVAVLRKRGVRVLVLSMPEKQHSIFEGS